MLPEAAFAGTKRFVVEERLGTGGMGVVYRAEDRELGATVALKTLRDLNAHNLYLFKREFRALADLSHPNLVRLGELFCEDGVWFFTMELISGQDFLAYVRRSDALPGGAISPMADSSAGAPDWAHGAVPAVRTGPAAQGVAFDERRLRAAAGQLALGIAALHEAGKVHRDVKPTNVLVTSEGRVVLLDFGLVTEAAAEGDEQGGRGETRAAGTVAYMAPEQAAGKAVGPEADWYSVGVVLYESLTGRLPITGSAMEVLMNKQRFEPPPPRALVQGLPADLDALCADLLRFDPRRRPPAWQILERLGSATSGVRAVGLTSSMSAQSQLFVGRERELTELRRAFDESREGRAVTVVLRGESGIGKSALARRFIDLLTAEGIGALVLSARCYERELIPYKAFDGILDALSRALGRMDPAEAALLVPADADVLAQLFPVLLRVPAFATREATQAKAEREPIPRSQDVRSRAFGALRRLLSALAKQRPVVLFIDDIQWADADSLVLHADLMQTVDAPALLLVATRRTGPEGEDLAPARSSIAPPGESARTSIAPSGESGRTSIVPPAGQGRSLLPPAPRGLLAEASPGVESARYVDVLPLTSGEAEHLVELFAWGAAPSARALVAEARGHPLFLLELMRHQAADGESPAAMRLDEALWARIKNIDPPARALLEAIAVAGAPVAQDIAFEAAALTPAEGARWLSLLRVASLARTGGARGEGTVEAYHDRVREAVLAHLDAEARRRNHARLVAAFDGAGPARSDPRVLVRHLLGAGDRARAAKQAVLAAELSVRALAFDQAAELYRTALKLELGAGGSERPPSKAVLALRVQLAQALVNAGRGAEAADVYLAAAPDADAAGRLDCQRIAAEQLLLSGHIRRGLDAVSTVLGGLGVKLPRTPLRALVSLLWHRFLIVLRGLSFKPRDVSEIATRDLVRLDLYRSIAVGLGLVDAIRGFDFQARALLMALSLGERSRIARTLAYEAMFRSARGKRGFARAGELLARAEELGEACGDPYVRLIVPGGHGICHFLTGRFREAVGFLWQAEAEYAKNPYAGPRFELQTGRIFRMLAQRHLGELREIGRWCEQYVRDAARRGDRYTEASLVRIGAVTSLARDAPAEARRSLDRKLWEPPEGAYHVQHWYELLARVEVELYEGTGEAGLARLGPSFQALRRSMLLRVAIVRVPAYWYYGRLLVAASAKGGPHARAWRDEASGLARRIAREDAPYRTGWAQLLHAALAAQRGDRAKAASLCGSAGGELEAQGLKLYAAAARLRQGELSGGSEGEALVARAEEAMTAEGVVRPRRFAELYAPGFETID